MEKLNAAQLLKEQNTTLSTPRRTYSWLARGLFFSMDLFYGRRATLKKFKVLEIIARVPYQAWENVGYVAITHTFHRKDFPRRIFDRVKESRQQQDNEQWHLLILEEQLARQGVRQGFIRFWLIPQIMAFVYYHLSWLLYAINPALSYRMNADFEDHAEHEYMTFVQNNPDLAKLPFDSMFREDYGPFANMADVYRQIGYDERKHKEESLIRLSEPRYA
ncbi:MAG: hypothetical protein OEW39_08790 [Deltaproteobacteria bacterium]|nr:hypothetical protein [Deltaproteobacteria bacterium]